jgi:hypothetical protein
VVKDGKKSKSYDYVGLLGYTKENDLFFLAWRKNTYFVTINGKEGDHYDRFISEVKYMPDGTGYFIKTYDKNEKKWFIRYTLKE